MTAMRRRCSVCGSDPYDRSHQGPNGRCGLCGPPAISKATAPALARQMEFSVLVDALIIAEGSFAEIADIVARDGKYEDASFLKASALRIRTVLALAGAKP